MKFIKIFIYKFPLEGRRAEEEQSLFQYNLEKLTAKQSVIEQRKQLHFYDFWNFHVMRFAFRGQATQRRTLIDELCLFYFTLASLLDEVNFL